MGAGGLFAGLIGGYSEQMLRKHKDEQDRKERGTQLQIENLRLAAEAQIKAGNMEGAGEALKQVDELLQDYTGAKNKKGGFSLGNLVGHFQDTGGARQKSSGQGGTEGTQKTGTPGSTPPVAGGGPPTRADVFKFPEHEKILQQQLQDSLTITTGEINNLSKLEFGKDLKDLDPWDKAEVLANYYKRPDAKMHPVQFASDEYPQGALGMQASNGQVLGPNSKPVANPRPFVRHSGNRKLLPYTRESDGKVGQAWFDQQDPEADAFDTNGQVLTAGEKGNVIYAPLLPTTVNTTTVQPSVVADPTAPGGVRTGPAITSQTQSTHQKVPVSSPPTRPKSSSEPPMREKSAGNAPSGVSAPKKAPGGLPHAAPKQLATEYEKKITTYRQTLNQAKSELDQAQKERDKRIATQQKSTSGITGGMFNAPVDVQEAETRLAHAKQTAKFAAAGVKTLENLRQAVEAGLIPMQAVDDAVEDIMRTGKSNRVPKVPQ